MKLANLIEDRLEAKQKRDIERRRRIKEKHVEYDEDGLVVYSYYNKEGRKRYGWRIYEDSRKLVVLLSLDDFPSFYSAKTSMDDWFKRRTDNGRRNELAQPPSSNQSL